MPVLLGYLLALAVLLGGGYVGLEWLTSPENATSYQHPNHKPIAKNRNNTSQKTAPNTVGGIDVPRQPDVRTEDPADSSASPAGQLNRDKANAKDAVPAGGCMPIGLTAQGEMVFPLQCRERVERERGSESLPVESMTLPSKAQPEGATKGSEKAKAVVHDGAAAKSPENSSAITRKIDETKPPPVPSFIPAINSEKPDEQGRGQAPHPPGSTTSAVKPSVARADPAVAPRKSAEHDSGSRRSKLVRMTLRTVEYPDGHREQRLLPMEHARRPALQAEASWYNGLGLR